VSVELLLALAALTYGSRLAALVVLPLLPTRVGQIIDRMPPALFAGLAAQSLVGASGAPTALPVLAATAGALVLTPWRSLPLCLVGGAAGYLVATYAIPALGA
jgi:branched-subunit amino acid transport protein